MPYPWECVDCTWLNLNDFRDGKYYCPVQHYYVIAHSPSCRHLNRKNNSSGGCYLTTVMCNTLGFEDNCEVLETLRTFRDNYMMKNEEYLPLLEDYEVIGPMISNKIEQDENKKWVANIMYNNFITPAIELINEQQNDTAINLYVNMTYYLMDFYNIDKKVLPSNQKNVIQRKREINNK